MEYMREEGVYSTWKAWLVAGVVPRRSASSRRTNMARKYSWNDLCVKTKPWSPMHRSGLLVKAAMASCAGVHALAEL